MRNLTPLLLGLLLAVPAAAGELKDLPANKWTVVHDGPPGVIATHAKLEWMPELKKGFMWPSLHYGSKHVSFEQHATVHYYAPPGKWSAQKTVYPDGLKTIYGRFLSDVAVNYVWLPGAKRVLLLHQGGNARAGKHVNTWLLDPRSGKWEALGGASMTHKSIDFNPSGFSDGYPTPIFGALVYDAHNREAVSIAGCGTWGRVGKQKEKLAVGDWFYDEAGAVKRVRRVLAAEKGKVVEGRKWFPANVGTWTFPEAGGKWKSIAQPIGKQPSGRILPAAAYDAGEKKIVLFGGDNFCGPLADTWVYDCEKREWSQAKPETSPPHRAGHAMVYAADQKCVLLCGGFGPGWKTLKDVWVYRTAKGDWAKLAIELPVAAPYCSAAYDPRSRAVLCVPSIGGKWGQAKKTTVLGLRLDLASVPKAPAPPPLRNGLQYHCKVDRQWGAPLPEEWSSPKDKGLAPEVGRKELSRLPANTWVLRKPPMSSRARVWGSYIYDPRTHRGYAWGGGHQGYTGCEMSEYDVLRNRWRSMNDVVAYKVNWRRRMGQGLRGPSFQGWQLMGIHARKSYAVDYKTDSVITMHGDVYSTKENRFVASMGRCPGEYALADQVCFEGTPDGVYAVHCKRAAEVWLADVKAGKWKLIKRDKAGGPRRHHEYNTVCHDRKRNRLFYTRIGGTGFWSFDLTAKQWTQVKPANKSPNLAGCPTYVDELDAILWVWGTREGRKGDPEAKMTCFKIGDNKFYAAAYRGAIFGGYRDLNNSTHYDPALRLLVRITHLDRGGYIQVGAMRLDPKTLKLEETK